MDAAGERPSSGEFQFNCVAVAEVTPAPAFREEVAGRAGAPRSVPDANSKVRCGGGRKADEAAVDTAEDGVDAADADDADDADEFDVDTAKADVLGGEIDGADDLNGTLNEAAEDASAAEGAGAGADRSILDGLSADFGSDADALASRGAQTGASAAAIRFGRKEMRWWALLPAPRAAAALAESSPREDDNGDRAKMSWCTVIVPRLSVACVALGRSTSLATAGL